MAAMPAPWAESTEKSFVPGVDDDTLTPENPRYQNVLRVERSMQKVTDVVAAFAEVAIKDAHAAMLATKAAPDSGDGTLGQLPPCPDHDRKAGDARLKIGELLKCAICGPWMRALAAAATAFIHGPQMAHLRSSPIFKRASPALRS